MFVLCRYLAHYTVQVCYARIEETIRFDSIRFGARRSTMSCNVCGNTIPENAVRFRADDGKVTCRDCFVNRFRLNTGVKTHEHE